MAAIYVEAPHWPPGELPRPFVFLAGGICGCHDWQAGLAAELQRRLARGTIFNPRRARFAEFDSAAKTEQITWEFKRLWAADIISYWFCKPTENPTTLFEYGTHLARRAVSPARRPFIVPGIEPGYAKEEGMALQTRLADPELAISRSLPELAGALAQAAREWAEAGR